MSESALAAAARVDAQEREDRIGGAGAAFRHQTQPMLRAVPVKAEDKAAEDAARYFETANIVRAIARTAVALAADAAGHDPRNHRTLDVATTDSVEKLLLNLLMADKVDLPPGFQALSGALALRKAVAVAAALDDKAGEPA